MENHAFDIVYMDRRRLNRFNSGSLLIAIKKNVSSKWKLIRSEFDSLPSVKVD